MKDASFKINKAMLTYSTGQKLLGYMNTEANLTEQWTIWEEGGEIQGFTANDTGILREWLNEQNLSDLAEWF